MSENIISNIYQGDDTDAFGKQYIKINPPKGIDSSLISKVIFQCGDVQLIEESPVFPLYINLSHANTMKLDYRNDCYVQLFDNEGKRLTLKGNLTVIAEKQRVPEGCELGGS